MAECVKGFRGRFKGLGNVFKYAKEETVRVVEGYYGDKRMY